MGDLPVDQLRDAVLHLHPCDGADFVRRVRIVEAIEGHTIWEGEISIFALRGHPQAKRVYVWSHFVDDHSERRRFIAVLHHGRINSPRAAVRENIVRELRSLTPRPEDSKPVAADTIIHLDGPVPRPPKKKKKPKGRRG